MKTVKIKHCAYCGNTEKLSREHVISKTLADKYLDGTNSVGYFHDKGRYTNDLQTIKDVCEKCNNGELSKLDNYFLNFLEANKFLISESIYDKKDVNLNYDCDKLSRWVLKTVYNSERKNAYNQIPKLMHTCKKIHYQ